MKCFSAYVRHRKFSSDARLYRIPGGTGPVRGAAKRGVLNPIEPIPLRTTTLMNEIAIALVTGANRGLGFEVCRQLVARGFSVLLSGRDLAKTEAASAELAREGYEIHPLALGTTTEPSVQEAAERIAQH